MKIDKAVKEKVMTDWAAAFPQLTEYSSEKLYKIVGPLVTGLELIRLRGTEAYRPHFVVYPLWKNDGKDNLDKPLFLREYLDKRRLQFSIPYEKHAIFFKEVSENVEENTPLPFRGDISLRTFFSYADAESRRPPLSASSDSYFQGMLQASKARCALYIDQYKAQEVFNDMKLRNWNKTHFAACKVDVGLWLDELQSEINSRVSFLERIEANKQYGKMSKLKISELIP